MTNPGAIERKKLTIISVSPIGHWGEKNLPTLKFKAGEGKKENTYEIFAKQALIDVVMASVGQVLECDVETSTREKEGQTYTDRKIKQIYQGGAPVERQGVGVRGGFGGKSSEERLSIERQSCLRCACDISPAGMANVGTILAAAERMFAWVHGGELKPESKPESKPELKNESKSTSDQAFDQIPSAGKKEEAIPKTTGELMAWAASHGSKYTKSYILANLKDIITEERLKTDVAGCYNAIKTRMSW